MQIVDPCEVTVVTVVAIGAMVRPASRADKTLAKDGIGVDLIDLRTVSPLDREATFASRRRTGRLIGAMTWRPGRMKTVIDVSRSVGGTHWRTRPID